MMDARSGKRLPWGSRDQARLAKQNKHLHLTLQFRLKRFLSRKDLHDELKVFGIDPTFLYRDPIALGNRLAFTVEEEMYLKNAAGTFSGSLYPAGFTKEETLARRKKHNAPMRAQQQRKRRADKAARLAEAADLDCRTSAVRALLSRDWVSLKELMKGLRRSPAFRSVDGRAQLRDNSLRQAILRELKGPMLKHLLERKGSKEKRGLSMHFYRLK